MKILHVNKSLIDVFWGRDGWEPHTRIRVIKYPDKSVSLNHISGTRLPPKMKSVLVKALDI